MNPPPVAPFLLQLLAAVSLALTSATAQCSLQWQPSSGVNGSVRTFATMPNGDLVAAGEFSSIDGTPAASIARRSGSTWQPLGAGIPGIVRALAVMPNGDLVAAGDFTMAGGVPANHIARWDGTNWSPLGSGLVAVYAFFTGHQGAHALQVMPNGDLIVGGSFTDAGSTTVNHIARWDGSTWSSLDGGMVSGGHLSPSAEVYDLALLPNGDLLAAGTWTFAGSAFAGKLARWNGVGWSAMNAGWPTGAAPVRALRVLANGNVIAGGSFAALFNSSGPYVARWTGTSWLSLGSLNSSGGQGTGYVNSIIELPDGDLLVGGRDVEVSSSGTVNRLLQYNGSSWSQPLPGQQSDVFKLLLQDDDTVAVGGNFADVGGTPSQGFAEVESTCPASVDIVGTSCVGPSGPHAVTPLTLPWLGGTFRANATNMPATSLALVVTSFVPNTIPLTVLLPTAGAGCDGLLFADVADLMLPNAGEVEWALPLPNAPTAAGLQLHQITVAIEFDALGNITGLTSTPRLDLTLGLY